MRDRAQAFLDSLDQGQRDAATYPFSDDERFRWQYTPGPRGGLPLAAMGSSQRGLAMSLLDSGLSVRGAQTARAIMALEPILKAMEQEAGRPGAERRDPEHYWFSVFGEPADDQWAWRVGGHHLCLHFTVVGDETSVTPLFFGANPARVPSGAQEGLRVLAAEEDLARAFLDTLTAAARARAVVSDVAPQDILTTNAIRAEVAAVPTGLARADLEPVAQRSLDALVDHYLARVRRTRPVDRGGLTFAWAGSTEPGEGHYYAIRGGDLIIEYDNTQNDANHVHTVWRDLRGDWGEDLLLAHYRTAHRAQERHGFLADEPGKAESGEPVRGCC